MPLKTPFLLSKPEDQAAVVWIGQELSRRGGHGEAVYAYNQRTGMMIAQWHGLGAGAGLDPALETAMRAGEPAILHHNHPHNGSFIDTDILSLVGLNPHHAGVGHLAEMWAHGNLGTRYRIAMTDPGYAMKIIQADQFMCRNKSAWTLNSGGHEIFAMNSWRHLICLCLEMKGYVEYDYDIEHLPNYRAQTYIYSLAGRQRLTQEQAFPLACQHIVGTWGHMF